MPNYFFCYLTEQLSEFEFSKEFFVKSNIDNEEVLTEYIEEHFRGCDEIWTRIKGFHPVPESDVENCKKYLNVIDYNFHVVRGSHGELILDENGKVLHYKKDGDSDYENIERFDFEEYKEYYGQVDLNIDILNIGYWDHDENYESPAQEFRDDIERQADTFTVIHTPSGEPFDKPVFFNEADALAWLRRQELDRPIEEFAVEKQEKE